MEIKVLVTGLWMGGEAESEEHCVACNYDYSWLFNSPSTLIWADKIVITPNIAETIEKETYPFDNKPIAKTIKKAFDIAQENFSLIEVRDSRRILTEKLLDKIDQEAELDRNILAKLYHTHVKMGDEKKVPGQIFIDGEEYCLPSISSIYASLVLAREWDARCLFSDHVLNYCKYKFGLAQITDPHLGHPPNAFNTIFDSFLPEYKVFPDYLFSHSEPDLCKKCASEEKCSREYMTDFEHRFSKYLEMREYDEIDQIKTLITDITLRLQSAGEKIDHDTIVEEFREEERKATRRIRSTFPKIMRWSNLALIASIPIAVVGIATGLPVVTVSGASVAGSAQITKESVKYLKNRYSWIGFVSRKTRTPQLSESTTKK
jgi:hypothetical protein